MKRRTAGMMSLDKLQQKPQVASPVMRARRALCLAVTGSLNFKRSAPPTTHLHNCLSICALVCMHPTSNLHRADFIFPALKKITSSFFFFATFMNAK